jgi:Lon-like protease
VTIEGAPTYGQAGDLLYLTVRVSGSDPNLWRFVSASLDSDAEVVKREAVVGCLSDADNVRYNAQLMGQSQDDATKVALERLGYTVTASDPEIVVTEVCRGVPAHDALLVGDRVVAVDGDPITDAAQIGAALTGRASGTHVPVTVSRDDETTTVEVPIGRFATRASAPSPGDSCARANRRGVPCFGIAVQTIVDYAFPIDVTFDLARVGGPSAGLAFALALVDDLTPGNLTGGARVAVTGAIDASGTVQPVGGVEQKAITARNEGVELMIVPRSELVAARRGAGDLRVVGVDTFDDALDALAEAGGAPVPPPTTTTARS